MSELDPLATTVGDICTAALHEANVLALGQTPIAEYMNTAWSRLQWMLQQWQIKRWLVFHLKTYNITSNGNISYSVGPGGDIDTGVGSIRPYKLRSAFLRQLVNSQPNQIDYPLEILQSMEDYNRIRLKSLVSFPQWVFYDPSSPLGTLYVIPVPNPAIYGIFITVSENLPRGFVASVGAPKGLATVLSLPDEYYPAILYNLALRLRSKYMIPTYPGDQLMALAKDSLAAMRASNTAIMRLVIPADMRMDNQYNIFNDQFY